MRLAIAKNHELHLIEEKVKEENQNRPGRRLNLGAGVLAVERRRTLREEGELRLRLCLRTADRRRDEIRAEV